MAEEGGRREGGKMWRGMKGWNEGEDEGLRDLECGWRARGVLKGK